MALDAGILDQPMAAEDPAAPFWASMVPGLVDKVLVGTHPDT